MSIRLSNTQREIVEASDGSMLVLASAGSGKTRVLTERIRHLFSAKSGTFKIIALTFTNKAADEMQSRLKDVAGVKERAFIGTVHKFCLELIRSKRAAVGIKEMPHIFEKENDRREILLEVFKNNLSLKEYFVNLSEKDKQKFISDSLTHISQQKKNLWGIVESQEPVDEKIALLFNEYNAILSSQNAIDFDDVICLAYKILIERPAVAELYRKMYKYICIDEAQDLNFAQYELIKALCGNSHTNVLMVGDPNQAIYGFNGSSQKYMMDRFTKDFSARKIPLSENFRSSKAVLLAAQKLIPNSVEVSKAVIEGEFDIIECENEYEEAILIASKIDYFLNTKLHADIEGVITADRIAVLARNKYVFKSLEKELSEKKIPFNYKRTNDLSEAESDLIKAFDLGSRILVNPLDNLHFIQLCQLLKWRKTTDTHYAGGIEKLESLFESSSLDEKQNDYGVLLEAWKLIAANSNNYSKALEKIERYINSAKFYSKNPINKALVIQDIEELKTLWKTYSLQTAAENKTLTNFRNQIALGLFTNGKKDDVGVTLGTIHSVKGLEFDIVFVMGMNEGTFPDYRALKEGGAALDEEKNNAFVALTRSKRLLYITYPKQKFMPWDNTKPVEQKPSRYLKDLK